MGFKVSDLAAHVGKLSAFLGDATLAAGKNLDAEISLDACGPVRASARALLDYVGAGDEDLEDADDEDLDAREKELNEREAALDAREALEGKQERSIDSKRASDSRRRRMAFDQHNLNDIFSAPTEREDASRRSSGYGHSLDDIFG